MFILACLFGGFLGVESCRIHSELGGRPLQPPRAGIRVGSLYYVSERPSEELKEPANLVELCLTDPERWGANISTSKVADIELNQLVESKVDLDGLRTQFVELGIRGNWSDYFSYRLTNVTYSSIDSATAELIFQGRGEETDCRQVRTNVNRKNWAIYQVQGYYSADVAFSLKDDVSADADLAAKLKVVEPALRAAVRRSVGNAYSGKGLVVAFTPILRN